MMRRQFWRLASVWYEALITTDLLEGFRPGDRVYVVRRHPISVAGVKKGHAVVLYDGGTRSQVLLPNLAECVMELGEALAPERATEIASRFEAITTVGRELKASLSRERQRCNMRWNSHRHTH